MRKEEQEQEQEQEQEHETSGNALGHSRVSPNLESRMPQQPPSWQPSAADVDALGKGKRACPEKRRSIRFEEIPQKLVETRRTFLRNGPSDRFFSAREYSSKKQLLLRKAGQAIRYRGVTTSPAGGKDLRRSLPGAACTAPSRRACCDPRSTRRKRREWRRWPWTTTRSRKTYGSTSEDPMHRGDTKAP